MFYIFHKLSYSKQLKYKLFLFLNYPALSSNHLKIIIINLRNLLKSQIFLDLVFI